MECMTVGHVLTREDQLMGGLDERWCLLLRSLNFLWHFPRTSVVVAFNRSAMNFDLACLLLFFLQVSRRRTRRILNRAFNFYSLSFFFFLFPFMLILNYLCNDLLSLWILCFKRNFPARHTSLLGMKLKHAPLWGEKVIFPF